MAADVEDPSPSTLLAEVFLLIASLVQTGRNVSQSEWEQLTNFARIIIQEGSDLEKKTYARYVHDGHLLLKEKNPLVAAQLHRGEVNFRILCKPLLDKLDSFTGDDIQPPSSAGPPI